MNIDCIPENGEERKIDSVYRHLRENILSGAIKPGQRIILREIANTLNVSDIPVREALQRLSASGLVTIKPYSGAIVSVPSPNDLEEILIVRAIIEYHAVLTSSPKLTDIEILEVAEYCNKMEIQRNRNNHIRYSVYDRKFHFMLVKNTYKTLLDILKELIVKSEWARTIFKTQPSSMSVSCKEHKEMLEALQNKDFERLADKVKQHRLRVGKEIKANL